MSNAIATAFANEAQKLRRQFRGDPHRPQYHFLAPANWMNDPNGVIHYQGRYHLFYQHNPNAPVWGNIQWGHAVSQDLIHWHDLPIALSPTLDGADANGCWSGCALVHQGVPTLIYTGVNSDNRQQACLATSDDDLIVWKKYEGNPIIATPPDGLQVLGFRDHSVWQEDGFWYQIIGSGIAGVGGAVLLYRSQDLRHWDYLHPLLTGDKNVYEPLWTGMMWECPIFFKLGDKHVLIISVHDGQNTRYTAYFTGQYHNQHFFPETMQKLDYGNLNFYAPQLCFDAQGRALLWGWLTESGSVEAQIAAGWSGALSLPRMLEMGADGRLGMRPVPEIEALRSQHTHYAKADLLNSEGVLPTVPGKAVELYAIFEGTDNGTCGIRLSGSADSQEYIHIFYDFERKRLGMKHCQTAVNGGQPLIDDGGLLLAEGEPLKLHIFADYSVIEVYANDRACVTGRFYPAQAENLSIQTTAEAGTSLIAVDIWKLESIWDV